MNTCGAYKLKIVNDLGARGMSSIKEQGDLFWTLTQYSEWNFDISYKNVAVRSFTGDSNLLQPTGFSTEHPRTSHYLAFACTHFNIARGIGSRCLARTSSMLHAQWFF